MAVFLRYNWVRSILLQFLQKVFKFLARFGSSASTDAVVNLHRVVTSSTTRCFIRVAAFHHQSNPSSANRKSIAADRTVLCCSHSNESTQTMQGSVRCRGYSDLLLRWTHGVECEVRTRTSKHHIVLVGI